MDSKWNDRLLTHLIILVSTTVGGCYFLFTDQSYMIALCLFGITGYQIKWMLKQQYQADTTSVTRTETDSTPAIVKPKDINKDTSYFFYKNIVMHVGIGLIIFKENGKVELINNTARRLLKIPSLNNIHDLQEKYTALRDVFGKLKTGGKDLVQIRKGDDELHLSVYAIELVFNHETLKLVSLQNIRSELEEKEMEAWQNLVRVLTHEIMNSVTPISSLSSIIEDEFHQHLTTDTVLKKDQLSDIHLSLKTIRRRSDGLIRFVKEFRSFATIPKPKPQTFAIKPLLLELSLLNKKELSEKNIQLTVEAHPEDISVHADKELIEQVLINLIKNAMQAFDEQPDKTITLKAFLNEAQRPVIHVEDNGNGIEPEAMEKIFIPFFTTKKTGSGIGLSLSRQIMRQHEGVLTVNSTLGKGSTFIMRF